MVFFWGGVESFFPNVRFVGIDIQPESSDFTKTLNLPWDDEAYLSVEEFNRRVEQGAITIDGVIAAVPPNVHYDIARQWAERNVPVWVEKPLILTDQLDQMESLIAKYPGKIFPVDFFMDCAPVNFLLANRKILQSIGKIRRFDGCLVENWPLESGREWLVDPKVSGGGLGMDILVHPFALADKLLTACGITDVILIEDVVCGRYNENLPGTEETYMYVEGRAGNASIYIEGGKGVDEHYYGVSLTGEHGRIDICTGMEGCDPYISIQNQENKIYSFPNQGIGYRGTFFDFLLLLYGSSESCYTSLAERLKAGVNSVAYMKEAYAKKKECLIYTVGQRPPVPEKPLGQVLPFMIKKKS